MDFSEALRVVKGGGRVYRDEWVTGRFEAESQSLILVNESNGNGNLLSVRNSDDGPIPWAAYQFDILADDWCIVED